TTVVGRRLDLAWEARVVGGLVHPELSLIALDLPSAALLLLVLGAWVFDSRAPGLLTFGHRGDGGWFELGALNFEPRSQVLQRFEFWRVRIGKGCRQRREERNATKVKDRTAQRGEKDKELWSSKGAHLDRLRRVLEEE